MSELDTNQMLLRVTVKSVVLIMSLLFSDGYFIY